MPELRRHDRPDQPERADDQSHYTEHGVSEIRRLLQMQKGPEKTAAPAEHKTPAPIQDIFDKQRGPRDVSHDSKPSDLPGRDPHRSINAENSPRERFRKLPVEPRRKETVETVGDQQQPVKEIPAEATDQNKKRSQFLIDSFIKQADNVDDLSRKATSLTSIAKQAHYRYLPTRPPGTTETRTATTSATTDSPSPPDAVASIALNGMVIAKGIQVGIGRLKELKGRRIDEQHGNA